MSELRNNTELLNLAVDNAFDVNMTRSRLMEAYRVLAKDASNNVAEMEKGKSPWSIGHQRSIEHLELEATLRAQTSSLSKLLYVLGRKDEFEALVADPFRYCWAE